MRSFNPSIHLDIFGAPDIEQQFIDLAIIPSNKVSKYLARKIDQFRPHLIIFSWRDIQIYAPVDLSLIHI